MYATHTNRLSQAPSGNPLRRGGQTQRRAPRPRLLEILEPRVLMSLTYTNIWIGNTWGGPHGVALQNYLADIYVAANGTVYTDSTRHENHNATGIYKNGQLIGRLQPDDGPDNAGAQAGRSVTSDGSYVYGVFTTGAWVRRFNLNGAVPSW